MSNFWSVRTNPAEAQRTQDAYNDLQGRLARERAAWEGHRKAGEARRSVEQALSAALAQALREYPDVFSNTSLSPATVDEWAARFAAQI